jgi:hypothetical protein
VASVQPFGGYPRWFLQQQAPSGRDDSSMWEQAGVDVGNADAASRKPLSGRRRRSGNVESVLCCALMYGSLMLHGSAAAVPGACTLV